MKALSKENKRKSRVNRIISKNFSGWLLLLPSLLLFVLVVWRPVCVAFYGAFFRLQGMEATQFIGLKNFKDVLTDSAFLKTLINTVQYVLWSLVIGLPLPFFTAIMINEMIHAQSCFKITTYLPVIVPTVATCLIWKMMYLDGSGGLLNTILYYVGIDPKQWLSNPSLTIPLIIIAMTWQSFGTSVIMYLAALQGVDQSLYEASRIDGSGFWSRLWHILFPHMRGILLLLGIQQIIGIFQITEQPLVMTGGGPDGASLSLGLTNYFYAFKYGQFDKSMALGVLMFLILIPLTFLYFKLDKKIND